MRAVLSIKRSSIAVVIVNFDGADDTILCINSLTRSVSGLSIVVVDNTPRDPKLRSMLTAHPDVKLISPVENLGFAKGNNLGAEWALENADCDHVFFLNNDACVASDAIVRLENSMLQNQLSGVSVPRIVLAEDQNMLWYGGGLVDWKSGGSRIEGFMGSADSPEALLEKNVEFATGCAMLVRRQVLYQTGGFDPRFFMYEEDLELSIRIRKLGWEIRYVPSALVIHKVQGSMRDYDQALTGKWSVDNVSFEFHAYHMSRNKLLNALIHARGRDGLVFLIFYPIYLAAKLGPHLLRLRFGSVWTVFRGLYSGLRTYFSP